MESGVSKRVIHCMFTRLLLLIAICTGLAVGPASLGAACGASNLAERCGCCVIPTEITCCEAPSAPVKRAPVSSDNSSQGQLKLAIQPLVALLPARLCVKPPVVKTPSGEIAQPPAGRLIDLICVRLI